MPQTILVLDKIEYKSKEFQLKKLLGEKQNVKIYYTEYEDALIRKVCKWKYIGEILLHILYWWKSFRYALKIFKENSMGRIICINPIVGVFLGMLNYRKKFRITLAGFLFEPKTNQLYYALRKKVVYWFLQGIEDVIVYARKEVKYYENIFQMKKFKFVAYGIDYEAHKQYRGTLPEEFIFSGGRSNRDYHTLIKAFENINRDYNINLCIATRPVILQSEDTTNVTILKDVVLENFGNTMERAKFIVLPLVETEISAGHQVLLEALERNLIVIVNRIDAIEDYVSDKQVIFYETGNAHDLEDKIRYVLEHYTYVLQKYKNNSKFYRECYTFVKFIERLLNI